jgi:hypothetical protein
MKKRKRLHDSEEQPVQTPIRGQPYIDEGNVILAVENTHFRVYYGVLAAMSSVFANMSSVSKSESPIEQSLIDGCPVIELDDSATDWGHVLRNIFERRYPLFAFRYKNIDYDYTMNGTATTLRK